MVKLSLILFLVASCGSVPVNTGYHEDKKPYRGTNSYKRDYVNLIGNVYSLTGM